jgi:hypothetical protein
VQRVRGFRLEKAVGAVKLITHLHLVTRLRISGAIPLLPLYVLIVWIAEKIDIYVLYYSFETSEITQPMTQRPLLIVAYSVYL